VIHAFAPRAWGIANCRYRRGAGFDPVERRNNRHKWRVRAKFGNPFLLLKAIFGFRKVRYRGIAKNAHRLTVDCALANLFMLRRPLLRLAWGTCRCAVRNPTNAATHRSKSTVFREVRPCDERRSRHERLLIRASQVNRDM